MTTTRVPVENPKPDIERFLRIVAGEEEPEKVPMVEYLIDDAVMRPILQDLLGRPWVDTSDKTEYMGGQMDFSRENLEVIDAWLDNQIAFWHHMGYDFIRCEVSLPLPAVSLVTADTADQNRGHNRAWQGLHEGPIKSWEDFETYPWPTISDNNFYIHRYICENLPEGLGFITCHAGGVYEHTSRLLGYEALCLKLFDQPDLVRAVADRLGQLIFDYYDRLLDLDAISAIFQGDDFGFNTQLLLPPDVIRDYFLVWHRKCSELVHRKSRPYYLHSCGKIDALMNTLIEEVQIDARHSFQDNVQPVTEVKKCYGDRIGLLGGIDVHKLATMDEQPLRDYIRNVIEVCAPGGRFAVGAGNSVPSYIPIDNYLIMLDEALS